MTTEVRTPFTARAVELADGGLWKKQILKFGSILYRGPDGKQRKLTFDRKYGEDLISAFKSGAFDQVPFQFADGQNRHNNDPGRTQGEVVGVQLSADGSGVDGILRTWGDGTRVVQQNPKLGVSARILENHSTSDGRQFPRAVQHVLATVDPQVRGMRPWERVESVDLSSGTVSESLDLSAETYERSAMSGQGNGETVTLELSSAVAELLQKPETAERLARMLEEDEGLEALAAELDLDGSFDEDPEDEDPEDEGESVDLSFPGGEAIEMANAQLAAQGTQIVELTNQLRAQRTATEVATYTASGLAPAVIEAAMPLLEIESGAIELSNGMGAGVDPGQAVRELLTTVIDLANSGHLLVDPDDERGSLQGRNEANDTRKALVDDWAETYG